MLLSKFLALASVVVSVSATCNPDCSDDPSGWMNDNHKKCPGSYQVHKTYKCEDPKWNFCVKSCSLEMGVHPEGGECCPPPTAAPPTRAPTRYVAPPTPKPPTEAPPTPAPPTPAPKDPAPKQPECKGDTTPLWVQFSPQWVVPKKCFRPPGRRLAEERKLSGGHEVPGFKVHSEFWIEDLCSSSGGHYHDRALHTSGHGPDYIEHGKIDFTGSQGNKISLPYCVPDDTKIRICFEYSSAPFWVWSELGEVDGDPSGYYDHCDGKGGLHAGQSDGAPAPIEPMPMEPKVPVWCTEPIGECPKYY